MEELLKYYKIGMEVKIQRRQRNFTKVEEDIYQNICHGLECIQELNKEYGIFFGKRELIEPNYE